MSWVDTQFPDRPTHPMCAQALICNASNMWSYWPVLWEAKLHGTRKPARSTTYSRPISILPGFRASGPIWCPTCSPPHPPQNTHLQYTCTHPAVIFGHVPRAQSGQDLQRKACRCKSYKSYKTRVISLIRGGFKGTSEHREGESQK